jgi:hypothetical protein
VGANFGPCHTETRCHGPMGTREVLLQVHAAQHLSSQSILARDTQDSMPAPGT